MVVQKQTKVPVAELAKFNIWNDTEGCAKAKYSAKTNELVAEKLRKTT
jgi:hypothetical protein